MPFCHRSPAPLRLRLTALAFAGLGAMVAAPLLAAPGAIPVRPLPAPLVNGVPVTTFPSVGLLSYEHVECTVTLIGCRTVLTSAHCLCYDFGVEPPRAYSGDQCLERPDLLAPEGKRVFFQHAGIFDLSEVTLHPGWEDEGPRADLAVLRLDRPVEGVRPSAIHTAGLLLPGSPGTVVGFGRTHRDVEDQSIKRAGAVTTSGEPCPSGMVCWRFEAPLGPAGEDAGLCFNDSGGPLFADLGSGPVVVGVSHSISSSTCQSPSVNRATEVLARRQWIEETAGPDLGAGGCGPLPAAFEPGSRVSGTTGALSAREPEVRWSVEVPPGTARLRVTLNGGGVVRPASNDFDLHLRRGAPPEPGGPAACSATSPEALEACEVEHPEAGTWHVLVQRVHGAGPFQVTATQLDGPPEPPPPPPPPPGAWLASDDLPGFQAKVRFGSSAETPGSVVGDCVAETLCVSGALAGRPEVFVKVIGPRPNGFLWVQVSRFTPSRVELWVRQVASGEVRHYVLPAVGPGSDDVPGLQDRRAF